MMATTKNPGWVQRYFHPTRVQPAQPAAAPGPGASLAVGLGASWVECLFRGTVIPAAAPRLRIQRSGKPWQELTLFELKPETIIGRHPDCDITLEAQRMGLRHARLWRIDDEFYIENLDPERGSLLNQRRLKLGHPVQLRDGARVDLPGYQLEFRLPAWPALEGDAADAGLEVLDELPGWVDFPETLDPPAGPSRSERVFGLDRLPRWNGGVTTLRVAAVIEETPEVKTFRLVGEPPLSFCYRPGQFVTLLLEIDGRRVQRSYSMSSSPSRPHTLDITVKRVPGGLVSNWLCDHLRPGDRLRLRGPAGHFSCLEHPAERLLFIAAGSGLTPVLSMCRWIADIAAPVDVKLLASFRSVSDIIFRRELEWLSGYSGRFRVAITLTGTGHSIEGWTGLTGRVSRSMIEWLAPDLRDRHVFLCGPESFVQHVRQQLRVLEFDFGRLHGESFGGERGVAAGPARESKPLVLQPPLHRVTFTRTGLTVTTDEQRSLLELAEAHGIAIDHSCRAGSCGECEVRCRGTVALGPECEIDAGARAAGWVYACSTFARSDLEIDA